MNKDCIHVVISDTHTGSNKALFIDRFWQGEGHNHTPTARQQVIRSHFEQYAEEVAQKRKGKRVRLIVDGDAIEGLHHGGADICTQAAAEMADIHIELMADFQKRIQWQRGDELYYVKGTEIHTTIWENRIGEQLNAQPNGDFYAFDFLELETNGVTCWFTHAGKKPGRGANEGNGPRNWLREIYYDCVKDGRKIPSLIYTGHVHDPTYSTFMYREKFVFKQMGYIILPSWQEKTRYAHAVAPVAVNRIGGVTQTIYADGTIAMPQFHIMES